MTVSGPTTVITTPTGPACNLDWRDYVDTTELAPAGRYRMRPEVPVNGFTKHSGRWLLRTSVQCSPLLDCRRHAYRGWR